MSGVAGAVIGLTTGHQPAIAQAVALVQGDPDGRGCTTNFIGYGFGLTSEEQSPPQDFNATDDTVSRAIVAATIQEPVYTPVVGVDPARETLSWEEPAP